MTSSLATLETQKTSKIVYLIDVTEETPRVISEHPDKASAATESSRLKFDYRDREFWAFESCVEGGINVDQDRGRDNRDRQVNDRNG